MYPHAWFSTNNLSASHPLFVFSCFIWIYRCNRWMNSVHIFLHFVCVCQQPSAWMFKQHSEFGRFAKKKKKKKEILPKFIEIYRNISKYDIHLCIPIKKRKKNETQNKQASLGQSTFYPIAIAIAFSMGSVPKSELKKFSHVFSFLYVRVFIIIFGTVDVVVTIRG